MDGDSLIYASGNVIITRPEIRATADRALQRVNDHLAQAKKLSPRAKD